MSPFFRPGLYRHYKGGLYVSHTYGGENVRPLVGWVGDQDGWFDVICVDGELRQRFTYVGQPTDTPLADRDLQWPETDEKP